MIRIVESFYECNGDPGKLKCSLLEEYALSLGFEVKAYDFRRNAAVRRRMEELRHLTDSERTVVITYKSIDVDALLNRNLTREALKYSIMELDETWRRVYEHATELSKKNTSMLTVIASKERDIETLSAGKESCETQIKSLKHDFAALALENRYLRKSLKQYLYPAIANEILMREHILEQADTEVIPETMAAFVDNDMPSSFSASIALDNAEISREEAILKRMEARIHGKSDM